MTGANAIGVRVNSVLKEPLIALVKPIVAFVRALPTDLSYIERNTFLARGQVDAI